MHGTASTAPTATPQPSSSTLRGASRRLAAKVALLLLATAPLAGGCLISSSNRTSESGVRVTSATLSQVQPGTTTEAWLLATLGEPTSRTDIENQPGQQILRYDFTRSEQSSGAVFLIFGGSTTRQSSSRVFFEVTNGVVTRFWQET